MISLKPALVSLSVTDFTAWKGVGEAFTNVRKSLAAVLMLAEPMVEVLKPRLMTELENM